MHIALSLCLSNQGLVCVGMQHRSLMQAWKNSVGRITVEGHRTSFSSSDFGLLPYCRTDARAELTARYSLGQWLLWKTKKHQLQHRYLLTKYS
ncbi:hypothetical protein ACET3Z_021800 [Daucus carota]